MRRCEGIIVFLFVLLCSASVSSCGKRGPSLPPLRSAPAQCERLAVRQMGDRIMLSFVLPKKNINGSPLDEKPTVDILRLVAGSAEGQEVRVPSKEEFLKKAKRTATIQPIDIDALTFGGSVFFEQNILESLGDRAIGAKVFYAVQLVNRKKKGSPLSDIVSIDLVNPLPGVTDLSARSEESGDRLAWTYNPSPGASKCMPLFNVYRRGIPSQRSEGEGSSAELWKTMKYLTRPLNEKAISENSYLDTSRVFGERYLYSVRAVCDAALPARESVDSNVADIRPVDVFPPLPPSSLSAVVDNAAIRLFWFPNTEKDLAGYKVYRKSGAEDHYTLIASLPANTTSFSDEKAAVAIEYSYYVTAFDGAEPPNESAPSETVTEHLSVGPHEGRGGGR